MVFVFDSANNILLLKRNDNNQWEPVKGGMLPNESWEEAGLREIKEEIGLKINNLHLFDIIDDKLTTGKGDRIQVKGRVAYAKLTDYKPNINLQNNPDGEHYEYKWISAQDVVKETLYPPSANKMIRNILHL